MIKPFLIFFILLIAVLGGYGQPTDTIVPETAAEAAFREAQQKKPVRDAWACTMLVDAQTSWIPSKGSFEVIVQHRFSDLENGIKDIFGIYGASNIRLAGTYSLLDRLMVGFATVKDRKYQEFFVKTHIIEQRRNGKIPLTLSFFGNTVISARDKSNFGLNYRFIDKLSYFGQLIAARKFCDVFSAQLGLSYSHFNAVEGIMISDTLIDEVNPANSVICTTYEGLYQHDVLGLTAGTRINFGGRLSLLLEYDQGFYLKKREEQELKPKPNVALGLEINTSTHCFHIFASSYRALNPQHNFVMNQFDFTKLKGLMLGFNITVRLN